jgi:aminomethyltransferase
MKQTPLYGRHQALGAKIIDFGGWAMPVQYSGILDEHKTVREAAGIFDVSHMGEVWFRGPRAAEAVQKLVTNDVAKLVDGMAMYTCA